MIIHHPGGLHVGIANGAAKKFEAPFFHVLANGIGDGRACGGDARIVVNRFTIRHKAVEVFIKRAELLLDPDK